jgi:hypothetical protein
MTMKWLLSQSIKSDHPEVKSAALKKTPILVATLLCILASQRDDFPAVSQFIEIIGPSLASS